MNTAALIKVLFAAYLLLMSAAAFILYAVDKKRAKAGKWRIKERTLLGVALIGGGLGALLGMKVLRHKTQHKQFVILVPIFLVLNIAAAVAVFILVK